MNLVYGACFFHDQPEKLLESLLDGLSTNRIEIDLIEFNHAYLHICSPEVLSKISAKNTEWESVVPPKVAEAIKSRGLFGYQ